VTSLLLEVERALARRAEEGGPPRLRSRLLAAGEGWSVEDVVCDANPDDRPFEECRPHVAVALVVAGSFQYRTPAGRALMTPGSALLGNPGEPFECAHEHGRGDRCVSFKYSREFVEQAAADAGARSPRRAFPVPRLPALPALTRVAARACAGIARASDAPWEELALEMAARAAELAHDGALRPGAAPPGAEARVARVARRMEQGEAGEPFTLVSMARAAGLSRYHFLRMFQRVAGVTPHQYLCRARLRRAATSLVEDRSPVIDVALDSGFGDVSNFNRAFRRELGMSPRQYRRRFGS
jgi:AraC family transcriptional regulator